MTWYTIQYKCKMQVSPPPRPLKRCPLQKLCEPPWNQCTVSNICLYFILYICWVTLAELIWLCSTRFHRSMPFCNGAVVFKCDVDGTCGQEGALLFWSAVTVLLQCLSISSIHSLSHTVTETQVKFLCVTCAAFFLSATEGQVQSRSRTSGWP